MSHTPTIIIKERNATLRIDQVTGAFVPDPYTPPDGVWNLIGDFDLTGKIVGGSSPFRLETRQSDLADPGFELVSLEALTGSLLRLVNVDNEIFNVDGQGVIQTGVLPTTSLPAPGKEGRVVWDSDQGSMVVDDGIAWSPMGVSGHQFTSPVLDSASAICFAFDTDNEQVTVGSTLVSLRNAGVEKLSIDKDGNIHMPVPGGSAIWFPNQFSPDQQKISGNGDKLLIDTLSGLQVARSGSVSSGVIEVGSVYTRGIRSLSGTGPVPVWVDNPGIEDTDNPIMRWIARQNPAPNIGYTFQVTGNGAELYSRRDTASAILLTIDSRTLRFRSAYWDGFASQESWFGLTHVVTSDSPFSSKLSFHVEGAEKLAIGRDGIVNFTTADALGGGAASTMGTIGGAGPTAAAQSKWLKIKVDGVDHWVPAWV